MQPGRLQPSPQVAGRPVDDAARAALTHALVVYGLTVLANAQAGSTTQVVDYFRDALVARAEQRLGLAGPLTYTSGRTADGLLVGNLGRSGTARADGAAAYCRRCFTSTRWLGGRLSRRRAARGAHRRRA
jgi:hypothetical protein